MRHKKFSTAAGIAIFFAVPALAHDVQPQTQELDSLVSAHLCTDWYALAKAGDTAIYAIDGHAFGNTISGYAKHKILAKEQTEITLRTTSNFDFSGRETSDPSVQDHVGDYLDPQFQQLTSGFLPPDSQLELLTDRMVPLATDGLEHLGRMKSYRFKSTVNGRDIAGLVSVWEVAGKPFVKAQLSARHAGKPVNATWTLSHIEAQQ